MHFPGFSPRPRISVVIPTYNRPDELRICLEAFALQTAPCDRFEVIVVDDGSTVDMESVASAAARSMNLQFVRSSHAGPGAARNIGIDRSRAPLLLLYDDDLRPLPHLIEYCLDFHRLRPADRDMALLYFCLDPPMLKSPLLRWAFRTLYPFPSQPRVGSWGLFWSGTLTCKKSLFRHAQFDPAYRMLEDVELGLRLSRRADLQVHFEPRLTGTFIRRLTFPQICRRQYTLGFYSHVFAREYRGSVDFNFAPYDEPEKYFVDEQKLRAMLASTHSLELATPAAPSRLLYALWTRAEIHARANGWMAARDGRPAEPPGTIGPFLTSAVETSGIFPALA